MPSIHSEKPWVAGPRPIRIRIARPGRARPHSHQDKAGNGRMLPRWVVVYLSWPGSTRPSPAAGDHGHRGPLCRANASGDGRLKAGHDGLWQIHLPRPLYPDAHGARVPATFPQPVGPLRRMYRRLCVGGRDTPGHDDLGKTHLPRPLIPSPATAHPDGYGTAHRHARSRPVCGGAGVRGAARHARPSTARASNMPRSLR
jgi:hypothetical protein